MEPNSINPTLDNSNSSSFEVVFYEAGNQSNESRRKALQTDVLVAGLSVRATIPRDKDIDIQKIYIRSIARRGQNDAKYIAQGLRRTFAAFGTVVRIQFIEYTENNITYDLGECYVYLSGTPGSLPMPTEKGFLPIADWDDAEIVCFWNPFPPCPYCKASDHLKAKCPNLKTTICFACNQPGHFAENCELHKEYQRRQRAQKKWQQVRQELTSADESKEAHSTNSTETTTPPSPQPKDMAKEPLDGSQEDGEDVHPPTVASSSDIDSENNNDSTMSVNTDNSALALIDNTPKTQDPSPALHLPLPRPSDSYDTPPPPPQKVLATTTQYPLSSPLSFFYPANSVANPQVRFTRSGKYRFNFDKQGRLPLSEYLLSSKTIVTMFDYEHLRKQKDRDTHEGWRNLLEAASTVFPKDIDPEALAAARAKGANDSVSWRISY
ncbi:hypothetical protein BGZ73_002795 [Actinomortierella ambigua]|nr:hypothetical protein BGZ73_002795 [Actinomortierella ambigua]